MKTGKNSNLTMIGLNLEFPPDFPYRRPLDLNFKIEKT